MEHRSDGAPGRTEDDTLGYDPERLGVNLGDVPC